MQKIGNQPKFLFNNKACDRKSPQIQTTDLSNGQGAESRTAPVTAPLALVTFCANKTCLNKSPNGTYIMPKEFPPHNLKALNLIEEYPEGKSYPYFDVDDGCLTEEAHAEELQVNMPEPSEKVIYVSNFDEPYGTVAGTSTLDKTLYTEGLAICAAMAVVDRANNTQTLIHVFPGYEKECNKQIIEHILSSADSKNLEISIIPGYCPPTASTLQFLFDTVDELVPDVTPKLLSFPKEMKSRERGLLLKNGELSCCNSKDVTNKIVNPKDNITYSKCEEIEWAKADEIVDLLVNTPIPEKFDTRELRDWAIDNNLKLHFCNMKSCADFEDADKKTVRTVEAVYDFDTHNHTVIKSDTRYIYDSEGNLIDIIRLYNEK